MKVSALLGISKLQGYIVDRREVSERFTHMGHVTHGMPDMSGLSADDLMVLVNQGRAEQAANVVDGPGTYGARNVP